MLNPRESLQRGTQSEGGQRTRQAPRTELSTPFAILADLVASQGRDGDTELIHVNKHELPAVDNLLRALGGAGTINPRTGYPEYRPTGSWGGSDGRSPASSRATGGNPSARSGAAGGGRNSGLTDKDITSPDGWGDGTDPNGPTITRGGSPSSSPGGGTYTSFDYSPGAVPVVPDPSIGQLANMFTSAVPVAGVVNGVVQAADAVANGNFSSPDGGPLGRAIDAAFGSTPGAQTGWAPDRNHGVANATGGAQGDTRSSKSPLAPLRLVPTQEPDAYAALLASLQNPRVFSSSDPVIVR
jgi:hypothetical protein